MMVVHKPRNRKLLIAARRYVAPMLHAMRVALVEEPIHALNSHERIVLVVQQQCLALVIGGTEGTCQPDELLQEAPARVDAIAFL